MSDHVLSVAETVQIELQTNNTGAFSAKLEIFQANSKHKRR